MRYTSTRDNTLDFSFKEALMMGYAPDGGLFVPSSAQLPQLTGRMLRAWQLMDYPDLMEHILRLYIDESEISNEELIEVCRRALQGFNDPAEAVNVVSLKRKEAKESKEEDPAAVFMVELFHGPTFCFKDLGLNAVVQLLHLFTRRDKSSVTLLASTTGDTGPAAVQAVASLPENSNVRIVVTYPEGQISAFQRRQMTTVQHPAVQVVAFEGGGDDMDQPIKTLLQQHQHEEGKAFRTGVNSYNIGRPLTQMVLFVWTYLRLTERMGWKIPDYLGDAPEIDLCIPTGAWGNITAGFMTKLMGLPIRKLISAVNVNDISHRVIQTADFSKAKTMRPTLSEAINIQVPYNFERVMYYLSHQDSRSVSDFYDVPENVRIMYASVHRRLRSSFDSARITDDEMCEALERVHSGYGYLPDPHTAVALSAAYKLGYMENNADRPIAILATASPCKFQRAVTKAAGEQVWNDYFQSLDETVHNVLQRPEVPPTKFPAQGSLQKTQEHWETLLGDLVLKLEE